MTDLRARQPEFAKLVDRMKRMFPNAQVKLVAMIESDGTEHGKVTDDMRATAREAFNERQKD